MQDTHTTFQQVKSVIKKFQKERGWDPHAKNLAISIAIEAAELLEHFQWEDYAEYEKKGHDKKKEIEKELADVVIYCLEFAMKTDIDVARAIEEKLKVNAKKYPAHLFKNKEKSAQNYYKLKAKHRKGK